MDDLRARVERLLPMLPVTECTDACSKKLQGLVEYALMYPYLTPSNKAAIKRMVPLIDEVEEQKPLERCAPYYKGAAPFELWFIRHSFSCNNNVAKDTLRLNFISKTKYDPGLTSQGIVDALSFDTSNLKLPEIVEGPLKVFASTSMRTWQTAVLLYAKHRALNLYVVPGLAELHTRELEYGNVPAPLPQQEAVLRVFIEQVYLQYGVPLHEVRVFAYNNPVPLMTFPPTQIKDFKPVPLESMGTRKNKNDTRPVCTLTQCKTHPLRPIEDPAVGDTWARVFSQYDKERTLFVALERVLQSDLFNLRKNGLRLYLCTTHSRAMQSALTNQGDYSLLSNPLVRDALNRDDLKHALFGGVVDKFKRRVGLGKQLQVDCPLPVEETPQFVSSTHNIWQLRFFGAVQPTLFCLTHMTMFQGFKKFTTDLGKRLDFNDSCSNDVAGLPVLIRKVVGLAHPNSRMHHTVKGDPSKGQTEKARGIVNRLKLAWHTRRYFRRTIRGG